jgi:nucleotide-binding universal stress UspA family protein
LDGSSLAEEALIKGRLPEDPEQAELLVLYCHDLNQVVGPPRAFMPNSFMELVRLRGARCQTYLDRQVRRLKSQGYQNVRGIMVTGNPVDAILRTAEELDVDLIVMTTHGRSGFVRLVIGSVTEGVLRRSTRPVLVIPPTMQREGSDHVAEDPTVGQLVL